jgi:hypothetical protein
VAPAPLPVTEHDTGPIPPYPPGPEFYEGLRNQPEPPPVGRRQALLGALLAVAGVVIGIVLLYAFRHDSGGGQGPVVAAPTHTVSRAPSATPTTARTTPTPTKAPAAQPTTAAPVAAPIRPVLVLNNSRVHNLAQRSADRFRAGGWPVSGTGNYSGGVISRTTIYYAPGQLGSAQRFAKQFAIPRVIPRFSGLPGSGLTVVLTRDYS